MRRTFESLRGDGGLMGHALSDNVAFSPQSDLLLFEVAPLLLVYKDQVKVVTHRELLVDVSHGGS